MNCTKLKAKQTFFVWDSFCVINFIGQVVIGCSSNSIFFKILYSFNVLSKLYTLEWWLVSCSPSLSYYSQILVLKAVKDSSIHFSSTVLYFNNHGTEEDVFFSLLLFFALVKQEQQPKYKFSQIFFFFTFPIFLTHHHF